MRYAVIITLAVLLASPVCAQSEEELRFAFTTLRQDTVLQASVDAVADLSWFYATLAQPGLQNATPCTVDVILRLPAAETQGLDATYDAMVRTSVGRCQAVLDTISTPVLPIEDFRGLYEADMKLFALIAKATNGIHSRAPGEELKKRVQAISTLTQCGTTISTLRALAWMRANKVSRLTLIDSYLHRREHNNARAQLGLSGTFLTAY